MYIYIRHGKGAVDLKILLRHETDSPYAVSILISISVHSLYFSLSPSLSLYVCLSIHTEGIGESNIQTIKI